MASPSSAVSGSSSADSQIDLFANWPYERLVEFIANTVKANKILKAETDMFSQYFSKIESSRVNQAELYNKSTSLPSASKSSHSYERVPHRAISRTARYNKSSTHHFFEKLLKLKAEDKCDIAHKEFERFKEQQKKRTDESDRVVDHLKAIIEEVTERSSDIKKEMYEFERDITKGGKNKKNERIHGEKVIRYFEDKIKFQEASMSKLRLKSQALRQQNRKLSLMLRHKEEIGDILTEIDFQQLKIENAERIEKIEERNRDFFRLKTNGTVTVHTLNGYKKKLHKMLLESNQLKQEIISRRSMIMRLDTETRYCESERAKAEAVNKKHRLHLSMYKVPEVMDAVMLHSNMTVLSKHVRIWERKNQIAEMALAAQKKRWNKIKVKYGATEDPSLDVIEV